MSIYNAFSNHWFGIEQSKHSVLYGIFANQIDYRDRPGLVFALDTRDSLFQPGRVTRLVQKNLKMWAS